MGCHRVPSENGFQSMIIDHGGIETPGFSKSCLPTFSNFTLIFTNNAEWLYINVFNPGGLFTKAFEIDDHLLNVIAIDGVFIEPIVAHQLLIPVGSRFTVLIKTKQNVKKDEAFSIRFAAYNSAQTIEGIAFLVYGKVNRTFDGNVARKANGVRYQDIGGNLLDSRFMSVRPKDTIPYEQQNKIPPLGKADHTINLVTNKTGVISFTMFKNGTQLNSNFELERPLLYYDHASNYDFLEGTLNPGIQKGDIIDIIIDNARKVSHPIHIHGHLFHMISFSDKDSFPFNTVEQAMQVNYTNLNIINPPYFDIAFLPPGGHAVLRFVADNPGIWLIHCHNLGHLIGGMGAVLFEAVEDIPPMPSYLSSSQCVDREY